MQRQDSGTDATASDGGPLITELQLLVAARHQETLDIVAFDLVDPAGGPLPPFEAGAHLMVEAAPGINRAYSLCSDPAERDRYSIAVLRENPSRGGSSALHEKLQPGDLLRTGSPRNGFALQEKAKRSVLIAGGIGITPILAMAERLTALQSDFVLHYCTRESARTAFVSRLIHSRFAHRVHFHYDSGAAEQRFDATDVLASPSDEAHVYVCGPAGFIEYVLSTARELGWAPDQLHREYFSAPDEASEAQADRHLFELVVASTGQRIPVAADRTAAQALQDAGVPVVVSCEQGLCGTCVTTVLEGVPDHRDHYLTESDRRRNDCFMPCCSRSHSSELVIDL